MFVIAVGLLAAFVSAILGGDPRLCLLVALGLICAGTLLTIVRRTLRISKRLREAQ